MAVAFLAHMGASALSVEQRWRAAESSLRDLLDATTDAIAVHRDGTIVYANRSALALFGYEALDEVLGRSIFDFVSPSFRALVSDRVRQTHLRRSPTAEIEERLLHRDGHELPVEAFSLPVVFEGERATLVHVRDLRARKTLEMQLRAADRLAGLGLIAAGIAHEVNTPLAYALLSFEALEKRLARAFDPAVDPEARELIDAVHQGLSRAASAAKSMGVFTRARSSKVHVDVRQVLQACIRFTALEVATRATLVNEMTAVPSVFADEARLAQVFLNLLMNAAEAIAPGHPERNRIVLRCFAREDAVVVEIEDTGVGIDPSIRDHVFDPLFTTKPHGTGLGLAISKSFVEEEGGRLEMESEVGRGSVFRVSLPTAKG